MACTLFYVFFVLRFFTVLLSGFNERRLKKSGAAEYGSQNSKLLILGHFAYYAAALFEGYTGGAFYSGTVTTVGVIIYSVSILLLGYVIYALRHVWTVKLIIAPQGLHKINKSFLFRYVRHPNYYLNVIPELIGIALVFHAWYTLAIGFPLYLIPLIIRIKQEEKIMKAHFADYK